MRMLYNTLEDEKRSMQQDEAQIIFELKCKTRGKKYKELAEIVQENINFLYKTPKKEIKKYLKGCEVSICSDGIIAWQI